MNVDNCNIVTASGDSELQMPAVGSEQAGSRGSSSNDCRDTGVASQAPVILSPTSAEESTKQATEVGKRRKRARSNYERREETKGLENANGSMRIVVSSVKLTDIRVEIGAVCRTRTGGILLRVKNKEEADKLSGRLQSGVGNIAKIGRPIRTLGDFSWLFHSVCTSLRNICAALFLFLVFLVCDICSQVSKYLQSFDAENRKTVASDLDHISLSIDTPPESCPLRDSVPELKPRVKTVKLYSPCKMTSRKHAEREISVYMRKVNGFLNKEAEQQKSMKHLLKYWIARERLFSKFSMGIYLDEESFYSVCPEVLSRHIAERCRCTRIIDPFCGAGGNVIQFANTCSQVIGVDLDADKIQLARNNAKVYGVHDRIEFKTGNYFKCDPKPRADVLFMSPPWGGPAYLNQPVYSLAGMCAEHGGGKRVMEIAREIAPKIAIHLPRNVDKSECVEMAGSLGFTYALFEDNYIEEKLNSMTLYLK